MGMRILHPQCKSLKCMHVAWRLIDCVLRIVAWYIDSHFCCDKNFFSGNSGLPYGTANFMLIPEVQNGSVVLY